MHTPSMRYLLVCLLALALSGCSLFETKTDDSQVIEGNPQAWQLHREKIAEINTWQVDGKVGIRSDKDSGSATLFWLQQMSYYDIRLSGPLGRGATRIVGQPGEVTLEISGQGKFSASSPEELLEQQIGWRLPLSHLTSWIKGIPVPLIPNRIILDDNNRLKQLQQDGWIIDYSEYINIGGYWLPQRIKARNTDLQVTLVAKKWVIRKQGVDILASN